MHKYWQRGYIKAREQAALDMPVGDPMAGPAFGQRTDIGGVVGGLVGGLFGDDSSSDAADAQSRAAAEQAKLQRYMYDTTRQDNMPAVDARNFALDRIRGLLKQSGDISTKDVLSDPGYQFGLQQGTAAIDRSAAARGGLYSGATLKALNRFGNDYGTTKYTDVWNRKQQGRTNQLNPLLSLAGLGQTASGQVGAAGQNYANQAGAGIIGAGDAQAAASLARGNIWTNAINRVTSYGNQNGWFGGGSSGGLSMPNVSFGSDSFDPRAPGSFDNPFGL